MGVTCVLASTRLVFLPWGSLCVCVIHSNIPLTLQAGPGRGIRFQAITAKTQIDSCRKDGRGFQVEKREGEGETGVGEIINE